MLLQASRWSSEDHWRHYYYQQAVSQWVCRQCHQLLCSVSEYD